MPATYTASLRLHTLTITAPLGLRLLVLGVVEVHLDVLVPEGLRISLFDLSTLSLVMFVMGVLGPEGLRDRGDADVAVRKTIR